METVLPALETVRLFLRPCTAADTEDLHTLYWNTVPDELLRSSPKPRRPTRRDIREENEHYLSFANYSFLRPFGRWLAVLKEDGAKIGTFLMIPHVFTHEEVMLCANPVDGLARFGTLEVIVGWALAKHYRQSGYGTEGARAVVQYGLQTIKLQRLLAESDTNNQASIRVMQKIGMQICSHPEARQVIGMIEK